jgi:DNA polymerase-3 subunit beta
MNNITINSNTLSRALQNVIGVIERKQTMPILGHVLIENKKGKLTLTGTDLEVQIQAHTNIDDKQNNVIATAPGRKLYDIIRSLDDKEIIIEFNDSNIVIKSQNSKFKLQTLPPNEFPLFEPGSKETSFVIKQANLKNLLQKTHFAMAQQDVRFYLNGLLLEIAPNKLVSVGTDGHRLARTVASVDKAQLDEANFIIPRKAVQEVQRIIGDEGDAKLSFSDNQATFNLNKVTLTTKQIDGSFPDYNRVIPDETAIKILIKASKIKPALQRVSILANEKFKGVRVDINNEKLTISSENPEQESGSETITIDDTQQTLSVGFNVSYLIDAVSACDGDLVSIGLNDENTSALITDPTDPEAKFVVMPMRL